MKNFTISELPALKLLAGIVPGIIMGYVTTLDFFIVLAVLISSLIIGSFLIYYKRFSPAWSLFAFSIGFWLYFDCQNAYLKTPDKIIPDFPAQLEGKVINIIRRDNSYIRCILEGRFDAKMLPAMQNQKVVLNIYGLDKRNLNIQPGSEIAAIVTAHVPKKAVLPTDFPEKQYAASMDVKWFARAPSAKVSIIDSPSGFYYLISRITTGIKNRIYMLFPESNRGVVLALITGDQTQIPQNIRNVYSLSGTAHVLSVSGLHVGIIACAIFLFLSFIRNAWLKFILFTLLVSSFVVLTGNQPAAIRSGFMAVIILYAATLQREVNLLNIVLLAVLLLILLQPSLVFSAGFQMSAASMIGIAVFYEPLKQKLGAIFGEKVHFIQDFIISSFSVSIAATLVVSPIVAYYFGIYSIVSPIANLFVVPLMSLSMIFSLLAVILSFVSMGAAEIYSVSANFLIDISQKIDSFAVNLPFAYLKNGNVTAVSILLSGILIYLLFSDSWRKAAFRTGLSVIVIAILLINPKEKNDRIAIFPRDKYIAVVYPEYDNKRMIILADRKPHQYPSRDIAMEKYLAELHDSLIIGINGNSGMAVTDEVMKCRKVKVFSINDDLYRKINVSLIRKQNLSKIVDL